MLNAVRRLGCSPIGATPGHCGNLVAPCPGRVDEKPREKDARLRLDSPQPSLPADLPDASIGHDPGAERARAAQKALVQPVHVDVHRVGLEKGAGDVTLAQYRDTGDRLAGCDGHDRRDKRAGRFQRVAEAVELVFPGDGDHAAGPEQLVVGKSRGGSDRKLRLARTSLRITPLP